MHFGYDFLFILQILRKVQFIKVSRVKLFLNTNQLFPFYIHFYGIICSIQILIDDIFGIMHLIVILREIVSLLRLWMNTAFIFFSFFSVTIGWYAISCEYALVVVARVAVGEHWLLGCLLFWHNQIVEWEKL